MPDLSTICFQAKQAFFFSTSASTIHSFFKCVYMSFQFLEKGKKKRQQIYAWANYQSSITHLVLHSS